VESGKSKVQTTEELNQWVKDHADDIYGAFLATDGACSLSLQYSNHWLECWLVFSGFDSSRW
jgi:hypothetical protein